MMPLLDYLTEVFIGTFGITRPAPEKQRMASIAIGGFLFVALLGGFAVVGFLLYMLRVGR